MIKTDDRLGRANSKALFSQIHSRWLGDVFDSGIGVVVTARHPICAKVDYIPWSGTKNLAPGDILHCFDSSDHCACANIVGFS